MKKVNIKHKDLESIHFLLSQVRKHQLPLAIFICLCLNSFVAPVVYANAGEFIEKRSAWALGVLGFVTISLAIYLLIVIFQPERF